MLTDCEGGNRLCIHCDMLAAVRQTVVSRSWLRNVSLCEGKGKKGKRSVYQFATRLTATGTDVPCEITHSDHSVTCHPAEVTFSPSPQPTLVLDLATLKRCKAELT